MKREGEKKKKQRNHGVKDKPVCGTLCYLAECRGTAQKDRPEQRMAPPDDMRKIIRMRPSL